MWLVIGHPSTPGQFMKHFKNNDGVENQIDPQTNFSYYMTKTDLEDKSTTRIIWTS